MEKNDAAFFRSSTKRSENLLRVGAAADFRIRGEQAPHSPAGIDETAVLNRLKKLSRMNESNIKQQHFANIQALRAVAALIVVVFHLSYIESKYFPSHFVPAILGNCGMAGVDLFFVISGFVMMTVSSGHFGRSGAASDFLLRRAVRIYPVYWFYA